MADTGVAPKWLNQKLRENGVTDPSEVIVAFIKPDGQLYLDRKQDAGVPQLERH